MSIHRHLYNQSLAANDLNQMCELFFSAASYITENICISGQKISRIFVDPHGAGIVAQVGNSYLYLFHYDRFKNVLASALDLGEYAKLLKGLPDCAAKTDLICFALENIDALQLHNNQILAQAAPISPPKPEYHFTAQQSIQQHFENYLSKRPGLLLYHQHADLSSYQILADNMPLFKAQKVKACLLELPSRRLKPLLDIFNKTGDLKLLEKHLAFLMHTAHESLPGFLILAKAAFENGIQLIAVDEEHVELPSSFSEVENQDTFRSRVMEGNHIMLWHIRRCISELGGEEKFIGLFGAGHHAISHDLGLHSYGVISEQFNSDQTYAVFKREWLHAFSKCDHLQTVPSLHDQRKFATGNETRDERIRRRNAANPRASHLAIAVADDESKNRFSQSNLGLARLCRRYGCFVAVGALTVATVVAGTQYFAQSPSP